MRRLLSLEVLFITSIESIPKKTINWFLVVPALLIFVFGIVGFYNFVDEKFNDKWRKQYKTLPVAKEFSLQQIEKTSSGLETTKSFKLYLQETPFILIHFWASWCIPCTVELPLYKDISRKFDPSIFKVVGILSYDTLADVTKSRLLETLPYTQLFDLYGTVALQFNIKSLPASYLLNSKKQIVYSLEEPLNEVRVKSFYNTLEKILKGARSEQQKSQ